MAHTLKNPGFKKSCALALSAYIVFPDVVLSQQTLPPQQEYYIGEGEVELFHGTFSYSNTDISIGSVGSAAELSLERYYAIRGGNTGGFGPGSGHNQEVAMYRDRFIEPPAGPGQWSYYYYVVVGRQVEKFYQAYLSNTIEYQGSSPGNQVFSRVTADGPYTYTGPNGLVINFGTIVNCQGVGLDAGNACGPATSLVRPDGTTLEYFYDTAGLTNRLRLVTSNFGYSLGFEYRSPTSLQISKVCAVNQADDYVTASAPCPSGARAATYAWTPIISDIESVGTYTDPAGNATNYTYSTFTFNIATIRGQASSVNDLTVSYNATSAKVSSLTNGAGLTWTYTYENNQPVEIEPINLWTDVTSPLSNTIRREWYGPGSIALPIKVTDPLNRSTQTSYTFYGSAFLKQRETLPEGNYTNYTYGVRSNVTETRRVAKPGSGLTDIVSTASYPDPCTNYKTCDKPSAVTDARSNTTNYTYDPAHGGVLTETGPAVNGVQPQKRYSYTQRYAWIKNSGGTYVQTTNPVWLRTQEAYCKTTAASGSNCAGGASDQVVTTYDYGPNSGPSNLTLKGVVVDSGGLNLRTCYGYDSVGNRISETQPKAGLTSCP